MSNVKPFEVSADWIYYAHNPGAESGQPIAAELCELSGKRTVRVPVERPDLIREIVSVAELYAIDQRGGDEEDRRYARRAAQVVKRGRAWLARLSQNSGR